MLRTIVVRNETLLRSSIKRITTGTAVRCLSTVCTRKYQPQRYVSADHKNFDPPEVPALTQVKKFRIEVMYDYTINFCAANVIIRKQGWIEQVKFMYECFSYRRRDVLPRKQALRAHT